MRQTDAFRETLQHARPDPLPPEQFTRDVLGIRLTLADGPGGTVSAATIAVTANLVATNERAFQRAAVDALDAGCVALTVDLTHCAYADSRGLGQLVSAAKAMHRRNARLVVRGAQPHLLELFDVTHLTPLFDLDPSTPSSPSAHA